jgi:deoxycytidylate deaminase
MSRKEDELARIFGWNNNPHTTIEAAVARCYELAKNSPCAKAKFGSVIVDKRNSIVGEGWNHSPNPDCQDCEHQCAGGIRLGIASGTRVELCHAGHAEGWAIVNAGTKAYGSMIYVAGTDAKGNKLLKDHSLPIGDPRAGFYCTLCIRHIWMAGLTGIMVDTVLGPAHETLEMAWNASYGVAIAGAKT